MGTSCGWPEDLSEYLIPNSFFEAEAAAFFFEEVTLVFFAEVVFNDALVPGIKKVSSKIRNSTISVKGHANRHTRCLLTLVFPFRSLFDKTHSFLIASLTQRFFDLYIHGFAILVHIKGKLHLPPIAFFSNVIR